MCCGGTVATIQGCRSRSSSGSDIAQRDAFSAVDAESDAPGLWMGGRPVLPDV